ncbi:hypothetical protein SeLEV6574_g06848 [Synchytrium endobioticum]|uniref:Uncharacterized protein n=1 Tax=Synchytrium endobioticum TaxID=286115 RepID=A0A507CK29_9FUNG|nr:hypothetical protein SeLEV6574_g06848 [Synchytrium endobioticum]
MGPRSASNQIHRRLETLFNQTLLHDVDWQLTQILTHTVMSMSPSSHLQKRQSIHHHQHHGHAMHAARHSCVGESDHHGMTQHHSTIIPSLHEPTQHHHSSSLQSYLLHRASSASLSILTSIRYPALTTYETLDVFYEAIVQECNEHAHIFLADGGVGSLCNSCSLLKTQPHVHDVALRYRFIWDNPSFLDVPAFTDNTTEARTCYMRGRNGNIEDDAERTSEYDTASIASTSPTRSIYTSPAKSSSSTILSLDLSSSPTISFASNSNLKPSLLFSPAKTSVLSNPRCDRIVPVMLMEMDGVVVSLNYSHCVGGMLVQKDMDLKRLLFEMEAKCGVLSTGHELKSPLSVLTIILVRTFITPQSSTSTSSAPPSLSKGTADPVFSNGECRRRPCCICNETKPCHQNKLHQMKAFGIIKQPSQGIFRFRFPSSEMMRVLSMIRDRKGYEVGC